MTRESPDVVVCLRVEDVQNSPIESTIVRCFACNARCWYSKVTEQDMISTGSSPSFLCSHCFHRRPRNDGWICFPGPATIKGLKHALAKARS